jgi:RNA polymerase sigma factor (sigma-70 family)
MRCHRLAFANQKHRHEAAIAWLRAGERLTKPPVHPDRFFDLSAVRRARHSWLPAFFVSEWSVSMLEQELLALVKSFLAKRSAGATTHECLAWDEFFATYDQIIRVCIRVLHRSSHVVDDLAQDVWIIVIRKLPTWTFDPGIGAIGAWVAKIARRLSAKRACRHSSPQPGSLSETNTDSLVDREPGPEFAFERIQDQELFKTLVLEFATSLPERDGRIVVMRFVQFRAVAEIARELNISDDCVWSVLHRNITKLGDRLRRRGLGPF